jgi:hypothetical protein
MAAPTTPPESQQSDDSTLSPWGKEICNADSEEESYGSGTSISSSQLAPIAHLAFHMLKTLDVDDHARKSKDAAAATATSTLAMDPDFAIKPNMPKKINHKNSHNVKPKKSEKVEPKKSKSQQSTKTKTNTTASGKPKTVRSSKK